MGRPTPNVGGTFLWQPLQKEVEGCFCFCPLPLLPLGSSPALLMLLLLHSLLSGCRFFQVLTCTNTNTSLGILQTFRTRLGCLATQPHRLSNHEGSYPLQCETTIVGQPKWYYVTRCNKFPFNIYSSGLFL